MNSYEMRLFYLDIAKDDEKGYKQAGIDNLTASLEKEPGTLFMAFTSRTGFPTENVVFEVYENHDAYQTHLDSAHYNNFLEVAKTAVGNIQKIELISQLVDIEQDILDYTNNVDVHVTLAQLAVRDENYDIVAAVKNALLTVGKKHKALLVGKSETDPSQWYILEVFEDEKGATSHSVITAIQHIEQALHIEEITPLHVERLIGRSNLR